MRGGNRRKMKQTGRRWLRHRASPEKVTQVGGDRQADRQRLYNLGNTVQQDFPEGSAVVKTLLLHCRGCKFDPWSGN